VISYDVVVPTVGRPSLRVLLERMAAEPLGGRIVLVDDRRDARAPLVESTPNGLDVTVLRGRAAGPAAARNIGARATSAEWLVFVDDDVELPAGWVAALEADLAEAQLDVAGVQGRIVVPLPPERRPTDWERSVAGLADARWATADMAYRRRAFEAVGGFDERFPRAYREDADLALRVMAAGWRLEVGRRTVVHPVRPAPWLVSVAKQAGNADDALMDRLHGRGWRGRAGAPRGRRRAHLATTATAACAIGAVSLGRGRAARRAAAVWLLATVELAVRRIAPGPRTGREVAAMAVTSAAVPFAATMAWLRGLLRARQVAQRNEARRRIDAVLVDRDGTIVVDVPYNGDPALVQPVPGARAALTRLRAAGVSVAVVTNQSGIARGLLSGAQVAAVNARVEEILGPFEAIVVCTHGPEDGCRCRKPEPGLIEQAARRLGVRPAHCAVIGDIGADVEAAHRAGAFGVLVPTPVTRPEEIRAAPVVLPDFVSAVDFVLANRSRGGTVPRTPA